jgi:hypothetical protein
VQVVDEFTPENKNFPLFYICIPVDWIVCQINSSTIPDFIPLEFSPPQSQRPTDFSKHKEVTLQVFPEEGRPVFRT